LVVRLSVDALPTANEDLVIGFASAYNATIDSVANNAWIKLAGASLSVVLESDDATTDNDDKAPDTAFTLTAATMYEFKISMSAVDGASSTNVKFFARSTVGGDWTALTSGSTVFKFGANIAAQPYVFFQKASSTDTGGIKVDYIRSYWKRGAIS
jgi:hypothetical protein